MKRHSFVGRNCFITVGSLIQINPYAMISEGCKIIGASHDCADIHKHRLLAPIVDYGPLVIGTNVFIGAGTTVLGGVTIGYGSIIASNSLVTSSVPPFTMYAGSPAVLIKYYDYLNSKWIRSDRLPEVFDHPFTEVDYERLISGASRPYFPPVAYSRYGYSDL
jgi:tetrahydrodipicolinate N-succinyltransferase